MKLKIVLLSLAMFFGLFVAVKSLYRGFWEFGMIFCMWSVYTGWKWRGSVSEYVKK